MKIAELLTSRTNKTLRFVLIFCFGVVGVLQFSLQNYLFYDILWMLIILGVFVLLVWAQLFWRARFRFPVMWIGLLLCGSGIWAVYSDQLECQEAKSSLNFAPTIGTVVNTYSYISKFHFSQTHRRYVVRYEYLVNGKRYRSSNVRYPNLEAWSTDADKYPERSHVCVYYDPSCPSHSCLERGYNRQLGSCGNYAYFFRLAYVWIFLVTGITLVLSSAIHSLIKSQQGLGVETKQ
jgi:hypothetical protein